MRVTEKMSFESAARGAAAARTRFEEAPRQAATGLKVEHPEDDPAAAGLIARHRHQVDQTAALTSAMDAANAELDTADGALDGIGTDLSRARELAVQLSNATYSANERAAAAAEVDGLFKHALGLLNTKAGHRYLFGGFQDDAPPFDATGAYLGDTGVRQVEVAAGVRLDASVRADVALKGVGGGTDVLGVLQALSAALSANNVAGVQNSLTGLDAGIGQVALARGELGGHQSVLDAASSATRVAHVDAQARLSGLADADAIDAATALAQAQQGLEAVLAALGKTLNGPSLLDRL